nr:tetratricopeptide repeat protein [Granulicella sp. S190]
MLRFVTRAAAFLLYCSAVCFFAFAQSTSLPKEVQHALEAEKQGAYPIAEERWAHITLAWPKDANAWAHLGLVRALQSKYATAVPAYRKALQLHSGLPGLHLDLGLALFKQEQFKDAIAPLKAAVIETPREVKPQLLLAMDYYGLAQYAEAIPYFEYAVTSSPDNLELRLTLAQSCLWAADYTCTIEQYQQILHQNPNSAQAGMLAGQAMDGLGRTADAIEQFRETERIAPHEPQVHFGLGYLLWKQLRFEEAEKEFDLELLENPDQTQALAYLGDIAMKHNDRDTAISYLKRAIAQPGATRVAYLDLGTLQADLEQNEEAKANFLKAIQLDPENTDAHWRLARLYLAMGSRSEAQAEFAITSKLQQKERVKATQGMALVIK